VNAIFYLKQRNTLNQAAVHRSVKCFWLDLALSIIFTRIHIKILLFQQDGKVGTATCNATKNLHGKMTYPYPNAV
jgi:hypothetical protein